MTKRMTECNLPCIRRGQFDAGCRCETFTADDWRREYQRIVAEYERMAQEYHNLTLDLKEARHEIE